MPLEEITRFSIPYLRVLDDDGQADKRLLPKFDSERLIALYRSMLRAREADQRMIKLHREGLLPSFPLSTGQEATACGAAFALDEQDWLVCSHRELGARLLHGESLSAICGQLRGALPRPPAQSDGSATRVMPTSLVPGTQALHAVGMGYAEAYRESGRVVLAFFGDGASSSGELLEALNLAAVWNVPVVFFCVNNQWANSTPRSAQTRAQTIAQKACAFGIEGLQVDGNDALAVYRAAEAGLRRARAGGGPTLIESLTYRLMMHVAGDRNASYRTDQEVEHGWAREPLGRLRKHLVAREIWSADQEQRVLAELRSELDAELAEFVKEGSRG